jgi:hypothetical protein
MEVQVSVAGFVWRGHSCPRTVRSEMALQASTDFICDLGRTQRVAPHRMPPFRTSRCRETLPTSRYGRAGGLRGACRFLSRLLPRQGCQRNGLRIFGAVQESRNHISPSPIRDTYPVAQFGAMMFGFDPKSHAAAERVTLTHNNAQPQATAVQEFLLRARDKVLGVGLGVRMRNAQRGSRHFARADEWHKRWNIRARVEAQRQPLSLQGSEDHFFDSNGKAI